MQIVQLVLKFFGSSCRNQLLSVASSVAAPGSPVGSVFVAPCLATTLGNLYMPLYGAGCTALAIDQPS